MEHISLVPEQQVIYEIMETSYNNIFVTGKAGSGKSVLLKHFIQNSSKKVIVLAPTGLSAFQISGQTIHSFFAFGFSALDPDEVVINEDTAKILRNIDAFIIDEISMVRSDVMECVNRKFQIARKNRLPFGGVQMLAFGDLYQLPPVVTDDVKQYLDNRFGGAFFFNAPVIREAILKKYELMQIHRQKEKPFQEILNNIREARLTPDVLSEINSRYGIPIPRDGVITLATTNKKVNTVNESMLTALPGREYTYHAEMSGDVSQVKRQLDGVLRLKIGAQVMMLRNDWQKRWANGTIGEVVDLSDDVIKVEINGSIYEIGKATWETIAHSYDTKTGKISKNVIGKFIQYPLCLAWAITIHKAQGQTHKSIAVDFDTGAFTHGQAYVALSRCQSLSGLYLATRLKVSDVILDERVVDFLADKTTYVQVIKQQTKVMLASVDKKKLEADFHRDILHCAKIIIENGYPADTFMKMISKIGGYKTAQKLIREDPSKGLINLASRGLLKYSLEALVLRPKYEPLFSDWQLRICRRHLETYGYTALPDDDIFIQENTKGITRDVIVERGDVINHKIYGTGVVLSISPSGNDSILEIKFLENGIKKFLQSLVAALITKI
ncbi:MAG: AAA family ATPase [Oscillospiraceae bacterium]|nr:AAA family ATPase [Oscillospiraceae bacterium]